MTNRQKMIFFRHHLRLPRLALGPELGRDLQFVAAHQAPGGVQDWQLAMATALQLCPLQLQRRAGLTLMDGALAIR